jgi:hypothetical protein
MKTRSAIISILLLLAGGMLTVAKTAAAELAIAPGIAAGAENELHVDRRYAFRRIGPQSCFLMPDVIVAVDALGPYCSSPRGYFHHYRRY